MCTPVTGGATCERTRRGLAPPSGHHPAFHPFVRGNVTSAVQRTHPETGRSQSPNCQPSSCSLVTLLYLLGWAPSPPWVTAVVLQLQWGLDTEKPFEKYQDTDRRVQQDQPLFSHPVVKQVKVAQTVALQITSTRPT